MAYQIKPASITAYLSSIYNTLQPHFLNIHASHNSPLITKVLAGMRKIQGSPPTQCKCSLSSDDITTLLATFKPPDFDNTLFCTMLLTSFTALLYLGEMMQPDNPYKRASKKATLHHSLSISTHQFSFHLPFLRADCFY